MADLKCVIEDLKDEMNHGVIMIPTYNDEWDEDIEYCLITKETLKFILDYLESKMNQTESTWVRDGLPYRFVRCKDCENSMSLGEGLYACKVANKPHEDDFYCANGI